MRSDDKALVIIIVGLFLSGVIGGGVYAIDSANNRDFQIECVKFGGTVKDDMCVTK